MTNEGYYIDLNTGNLKLIDRSDFGRIRGHSWSPDGRWVAYGFRNTHQTSVIKLYNTESDKKYEVTKTAFRDLKPTFDPEGKYLYFISYREFDPVSDQIGFDYDFPKGMRLMLVTLRKDLPSPFIPTPRAPGEEKTDKNEEENEKESEEKDKEDVSKIEIDVEGIKERVVAFPVEEGIYEQIEGVKGKVFFTSLPIEGTINLGWFPDTDKPKATLETFSFDKLKKETYVKNVTDFELSKSGKTMIYKAGSRLRVLPALKKVDEKLEKEEPSRESGWLDLSRIKISVDPVSEWKQMYRETWRLLRDHYYVEDMADVDWEMVYERYLPLLDRISTRAELSDILWELGGELGTSHAYEIGGEYRKPPVYTQGFLGVDFEYDKEHGQYKISHIVRGDSWKPDQNSPLNVPGINIEPGQALLAINGQKVSAECSPQELLVNQGEQEVSVTFTTKEGETKNFTVKTLKDETKARLREWVNKNTEYVHEKTGGKIGYVFLPDMGPQGFAEFHRHFLVEAYREGLIVDVRNNVGGHISPLILEKLAKKRVGYSIPRWGEPDPNPSDAVDGPIVCLTDEHSGSDGDLFSHTFKQMKIGLLIGKRTWGGIIGLNPTHPLVDGTITTQPEFFNWYFDIEWGLENCGATPDIEVDLKPQDYVEQRDTQLDRAIEEIIKLVEKTERKLPDVSKRPSRKIPKLP